MKQGITVGWLTFALIGIISSQVPAADILFMQQGNSLFDTLLIEHLESVGHTVTPLDTGGGDGDLQIEEAEIHDVVYITESLSSTTTHDGFETFLKEVETPQIWAEAYAWDEAAMTGDLQFVDFGNTQRANIDEDPIEEFNEGQDSFFIGDPSHCLAAGFTDTVQVYEDLYSLNWGLTETMGPGADIVGSVDEAGEFATLFVYEQGAELEDGTPAAGMRIGFWLGQAGIGAPVFDNLTDDGLKLIETAIDYATGNLQDCGGEVAPHLEPGDADRDLDFDQLDIVKVSVANKYLSGQSATWGEGDWNGGPGGTQDNPPVGNGFFDQLDVIAALSAGKYLTGKYAALAPGGVEGDEQTTLVYDANTGELSVDAPASTNLTSIFVTSAGNSFLGDKPPVLDGPFDSFGADNIFKSTIGGSFGDISFGNVLPSGISEGDILADLSASGSLDGGGGLGDVDLVYIPEPVSLLLLILGVATFAVTRQRSQP